MHNSWRQGTPGRVYAYTERDKLKLKEIMEEDKIELPNGMAWDEGKQLMYFADTGMLPLDPQSGICLLQQFRA